MVMRSVAWTAPAPRPAVVMSAAAASVLNKRMAVLLWSLAKETPHSRRGSSTLVDGPAPAERKAFASRDLTMAKCVREMWTQWVAGPAGIRRRPDVAYGPQRL